MSRTPLSDMAVKGWGIAAKLRSQLDLDPESG